MKTVRVNKDELRGIIDRNRQGHKAQYEKAFAGYQKECMEILQANLESLRSDRGHIVRFMEHPPSDHTVDYERVLAMLDLEVERTVELTEREFAQYVQDDWDWKEQWMSSNTKYTNKP